LTLSAREKLINDFSGSGALRPNITVEILEIYKLAARRATSTNFAIEFRVMAMLVNQIRWFHSRI
jgi:hypothetical protein